MWAYFLLTVVLFYVLTPGMFLSLPPAQPFWIQALTHAVVFALVHKYVQHGLLRQ